MRWKHVRGLAVPFLLMVWLGAGGQQALLGQQAPLIEAVKSGDTEAVRALLRQSADVNASGVDGTTALHWAVHRDSLELVDLLLRAGANAKAVNRYDVPVLSLACTNGNATIIEQLLRAGADPNVSLPGGETALMTAARTGSVEALRVLLVSGAAVDAREHTREQTALMWAAAQGNTAAVKLLGEAGANVHARSNERNLRYGIGNTGTRPAGDRVGQPTDISFTPLLFAVRAGHIDTVRALLDMGANANDVTPDGTNALVIAAINAHWELGTVLLERGADPNLAAAQSQTPLHQVVRTRRLPGGYLPFPVATGDLSGLDFAKALLAHGADPNVRMTENWVDGYRNGQRWTLRATPYFIAAKGGDHDMMRLLLANGADPTVGNHINTSPLMAAAGVEIRAPGEETGRPEDHLEAVRIGLALGGDVNAANDDGNTALHGAAHFGVNRIVQLLVDSGAQLDAKNRSGHTPYMIAEGKDITGRVLFVTGLRQPDTAQLLGDLLTARGLPVDELPDAVYQRTETDAGLTFIGGAKQRGTKNGQAQDTNRIRVLLPAGQDAQKDNSEKK